MSPHSARPAPVRAIGVAVVATALVGMVGMELLGNLTRGAQDVRATLLETTALVNRHSALEWQVVATGTPDGELREAIEANDGALGAQSVALLRANSADPQLRAFLDLIDRYRAGVRLMLEYLRDGDLEQAEATDEEVVDPLFDSLHEQAHGLLAAYAERARLTTDLSRSGAVILLSVAAASIAFLARRATRHEAEVKVEARFRSLVQNSSDLVTVIRPDNSVSYSGPSIERLLGHSSSELIDGRYTSLVHPEDVPRLELLIDGARQRTGVIGAAEVVRMRHADGSWRSFETVVRNLQQDPDIAGLILTARDATERERLAERVRYQASHDDLTGLANRRTFLRRLEQGLSDPGRIAVLFLDIDDFKGLNDNLGHVVGDRVLAIVGARVQEAIRPADLAARLGGDEFGILLADVDLDAGPRVLADRLLQAVSAPMDLDGSSFRLSVSVGITVGRAGAHAADLLSEADLAMYAAKRAGKGRSAVFEPSLQAASRERLDLQRDLAQVIDRGELVVHYQPIVSLPDGVIEGVEALVRWIHPVRGLVPPTVFIPLAEETGLIAQIGEWVLAEAVSAAATWRRTAPGRELTMSVNVSVCQLVDPAFAGLVSSTIGKAGLPPSSLIIEITEGVFADPLPALSENLERLRAMGVKIAIDDFGTGYSSLGYLPRLPVDLLKIDRAFVGSPDGASVDPALARAIIAMAQALGLRTIAEGVESYAQLDRMRDIGCQMAQGYVLSRPVPAEVFTTLLADQATGKGLPLSA